MELVKYVLNIAKSIATILAHQLAIIELDDALAKTKKEAEPLAPYILRASNFAFVYVIRRCKSTD